MAIAVGTDCIGILAPGWQFQECWRGHFARWEGGQLVHALVRRRVSNAFAPASTISQLPPEVATANGLLFDSCPSGLSLASAAARSPNDTGPVSSSRINCPKIAGHPQTLAQFWNRAQPHQHERRVGPIRQKVMRPGNLRSIWVHKRGQPRDDAFLLAVGDAGHRAGGPVTHGVALASRRSHTGPCRRVPLRPHIGAPWAKDHAAWVVQPFGDDLKRAGWVCATVSGPLKSAPDSSPAAQTHSPFVSIVS